MVGDIFQPTHLLFVLVVALLVLGPKRLPEVGRTLGAGIRDFRQALSGEPSDHAQRTEAGQVSNTATELRHQPDTVVQPDIHWPEQAVGPDSFDEPTEAASSEPTPPTATTRATDADWPEHASGPTSFDEPTEAASPEPTATAPTETADRPPAMHNAADSPAGTLDAADSPAGTLDAADSAAQTSAQPASAEPAPVEPPAESSGSGASPTDSHD